MESFTTGVGAPTFARGSVALSWLLSFAVILAVAQITLGGVVRITGSGDACPDWPTCHGSLIPPFFDYRVALEWSHRASGAVLGAIILISTIVAWSIPTVSRRVAWLTTIALVLVSIAGIVGGTVVLSELNPFLRAIHLTLAELTVLLTILVAVAARQGGSMLLNRSSSRVGILLRISVILTLVTLITGALVVWRGAGISCPDWPLCNGLQLPRSELEAIHMLHRLLSAVSVVFAAYSVHKAIKIPERRGRLWQMLAWSTMLVLVVQVAVGGLNQLTDLAGWVRAAHLSLATISWAQLCWLLVLHWRFSDPESTDTTYDGTGVNLSDKLAFTDNRSSEEPTQ